MTIRRLFLAYKNIETRIPKEILDLKIGEKRYDKSYIVIKEFLKQASR